MRHTAQTRIMYVCMYRQTERQTDVRHGWILPKGVRSRRMNGRTDPLAPGRRPERIPLHDGLVWSSEALSLSWSVVGKLMFGVRPARLSVVSAPPLLACCLSNGGLVGGLRAFGVLCLIVVHHGSILTCFSSFLILGFWIRWSRVNVGLRGDVRVPEMDGRGLPFWPIVGVRHGRRPVAKHGQLVQDPV
ncbi:hypothetical protein IWZ03DRAFT_171339 [Phyllosticta citriasiana]|uniref:Uncharacterized protein n=1 Tax=Phyllosticta citriasiana TaxID=595635 RepID=A0ABR1KNX5_9PEZI